MLGRILTIEVTGAGRYIVSVIHAGPF